MHGPEVAVERRKMAVKGTDLKTILCAQEAPFGSAMLDADPINTVEVKTPVKPVQNAIAILRYLTQVGCPSTVTQIANAIAINCSTCFNILRTMVGEGVLKFDSDRKTYSIDVGFLNIAAGAMSEADRIAAALIKMKPYAERYRSTVCLWKRYSADRNILVGSEHGGQGVRIHMEVGHKLPVLLGSTGRVMLPYLNVPRSELRRQFKSLRWFRPPTFEQFLEDAAEAEMRGWAVDDGDFSAGVLAISTPIVSKAGNVLYSVSAIAFRDQYAGEDLTPLGRDLAELAGELKVILY